MLNALIRFFKRTVVLIPGLAAAYFATKGVYPFLDRQVIAPVAVLGAYIIAAYVLIPSFMRVVRFFLRPSHIPHYSVTADGFASDPVNIGVIGPRDKVIAAMTAAGWHLADKRTIKSSIQFGWATLFRRQYLKAPFSNLYLFGRKQDLGFQLPIKGNPYGRHHVRFWACPPPLTEIEERHLAFWRVHLPTNGRQKAPEQLWLGAASLDVGLGIILHNAQLTHTVHSDTDAERNLIVKMLTDAKQVAKKRIIKIGEAYKLRNRVFRAHLKTDGRVVILTLKT